jgi:hypothetical protein
MHRHSLLTQPQRLAGFDPRKSDGTVVSSPVNAVLIHETPWGTSDGQIPSGTPVTIVGTEDLFYKIRYGPGGRRETYIWWSYLN